MATVKIFNLKGKNIFQQGKHKLRQVKVFRQLKYLFRQVKKNTPTVIAV